MRLLWTAVPALALFGLFAACSASEPRWGTPDTTSQTAWVSYGYPGGMNVQPINQVVVPPVPK